MKHASGFDAAFARAAPITFILIWSTGWIVARYAADFADPLAFLAARYFFAAIALGLFAWLAKAAWPEERAQWGHALFSGVLLHAIYLGGVWWAISKGLPASVSALIASVQPILTAVLAPALLGERMSFTRACGVALGFAGLVIVLAPKLFGVSGEALREVAALIAINVVAMIAVTAGTFYQKHFIRSGDLRSVAFLQYIGALIVTVPVALWLGQTRLAWSPLAVGVMAWSVLALSIGAIALLLLLIRRGEVSRSAQLIYLVPAVAAIQAHFLFGENLSPLQLAGMAITAVGVALASRTPRMA